jgi:hypothetical protein
MDHLEVLVPARPHDISDLHLAPVVLALDARLDDLGQLTLHQLAMRVALESDRSDFTRVQREGGLLEAIRHIIDCHGWTLSWDVRGVRLTHAAHSVVLGVPATFTEFLAGASHATTSKVRV